MNRRNLYQYSFFEKRERSYRVEHEKKGCRNHIKDIFAANTIIQSVMEVEDIIKLKEMLGEEAVCQVDDSIIFSICELDKVSPLYRLKQKKMIAALRRELHEVVG